MLGEILEKDTKCHIELLLKQRRSSTETYNQASINKIKVKSIKLNFSPIQFVSLFLNEFFHWCHSVNYPSF